MQNFFLWPIFLSAKLVQRFLGDAKERRSREWTGRLRFADFFYGLIPLFAAAGIGAFLFVGWMTAGSLEANYVNWSAVALKNGDHERAVVGYERLTTLHPDEPKYRFALAIACAQSGELQRAREMMKTLAPANETGYPPAQIWLATRSLAENSAMKVADLREIESRLIHLRPSPEYGPEATLLLARLYAQTGRMEFVFNEPALRAAAESVPDLRLRLLQTGSSRMSPSKLQAEAAELTRQFQNKLAASPDDFASRRLLAQTQVLLGDFSAAAVTLNEGLTLRPDDREMRAGLTAVAVTRARAAFLSKTSPTVRKELCRQAVEALQRSDPQTDETTLQLAQMHRLADDREAAERCYRSIAEKTPAIRMEFAEFLSAVDKPAEARAEYERVVADYESSPPNDGRPSENGLLAGVAMLRLQRFDGAEKILLPLAPRLPAVRAELAQAYVARSDAAAEPSERLNWLSKALQTEPYFLPAAQRLLRPLGDEESNRAARQRLIDLAAKGDAPAAVYLLLGTDALSRDDSATAQSYFELAARLTPDSPIILNNLAWTLAFSETPDLQRALTLAETALKKAPGNPKILDTRGRIFAKLGRWKEAAADLEACLKTYDDQAEFHELLAEAYERLMLAELSERHRRRARELKPEPTGK